MGLINWLKKLACVRVEKPLLAGATTDQIKEFLANVRPMDLIVFRSSDVVSQLISDMQNRQVGLGEVSHVEVAITREWCPRIGEIRAITGETDNDNTLFAWGSTLSGPLNDNVFDAESGGTTFGVQIRVLADLVREYSNNPGANIGVCRLINNPTVKLESESADDYVSRTRELKNKIATAYDVYNGRMYDVNPLALLGSLFPRLRPLRAATDELLKQFINSNEWLFCSEWVAVLYEAVGVIDDSTDGIVDGKTLNPKDVLPVDFIGGETDPDGIIKPICELPPIWVKN